MHSHIDIKVNSHSMVLPADFSMEFTDQNPLFHDTEMHSDPVAAPMDGNREVFQNVDDPNSDLRPVSLEHLPAAFSIMGVPFRSGTVVVQEDAELVDSFAFNIDESTQSFKDLIGNLKCQDVPLFNNEMIPVGEKVCDVNVTVNYDEEVNINWTRNDGRGYTARNAGRQGSGSFNPQALGFSYPGRCSDSSVTPRPSPFDDGSIPIVGGMVKNYPTENANVRVPIVQQSFVNVSEPYRSVGGKPAQDSWRYCNARVCYTHYGLDTSKAEPDETDDNGKIIRKGTIGETKKDVMKVDINRYSVNEDYGPYWVLDADRPQTGLCFYVLYFLDCLFAHLGVEFDNSALTAIEDMRRLCFFTTHHRYVTDTANPVKLLYNIDQINEWLYNRGCGGRIEVNDTDEKNVDEITLDYPLLLPWGDGRTYYKIGDEIQTGPFSVDEVNSITTKGHVNSFTASAKVCTMYATSENFPDESVQTVLDSLEASFGIRFYYDYQRHKVTAYLLRDVLRQVGNDGTPMEPITLPCTVLSVNKLTEKITGVRMKYSSESDSSEQQQNVRRAKRDYDTEFDYIDYRNDRTKVDSGYLLIANDKHAENITCYVDLQTANAYRFKISKDVDGADIASHRLFEVGQFKGIEVGDCSTQNESFVKELISDFQPMSFNDVNAYDELRNGSTQPILAAYVDEDMEHEFVTQKINHTIASSKVDMFATEVLNLIESYDPTQTDDGNSPLQTAEWGLAISIMRGGGTNAKIINYAPGYDGFGNSRWKTIADRYVMSSDTMDQFGNKYDYNGDTPGDGGGERFSLKIRSYKPFLYYIDASGKTVVTSDLSLKGKPVDGVSGKTWLEPCDNDDEVRRRGLAEVFMSEYIHFLLHRKFYRIHCLMEPAVLADIPNHWFNRYRIGDKLGFIDSVKYGVSAENGIGEVIIDFFAM